MKALIHLAAVLAICLTGVSVFAGSNMITYQGRLTDPAGQPVANGTYGVRFRIYQEEASPTPVWQDEVAVTTVDGLFSVILGMGGSELGDDVFQYGRAWLGVTLEGGTEMLPRTLLTAVPFAARAFWTDRADIAYAAGPNSITSSMIANGTIQPVDLSGNGALPGDVLTWDGAQWAYSAGATNAINGVYGGAGLLGGGTAGNITLEIAPNGVTSAMIATGAVTGSDLANGAVSNSTIADNSVSASKLQSNSVTTAKIQDAAVTAAKIGANAVGTTQITDGSVTTNDIANSTIINADISGSADISPNKISGTAATLAANQIFTGYNYFTQRIQIGATSGTTHELEVSSSGSGVSGATVFIKNTHSAGMGMIVEATSSDLPLLISQKGAGDILRCDSYTGGWHPVFKVKNDGTTEVSVLTITGGADVAEPFPVNHEGELAAGSIVVIDELNPGSLRLSDRPYDSRVAGIVSGANGVKPGLTLSQQDELGGGRFIALSGRVYALVDATYGPIRPGDMLTTSATPGHAMKATDRGRAYGAVIGKAMSGLDNGRGLVLVLVNLQ